MESKEIHTVDIPVEKDWWVRLLMMVWEVLKYELDKALRRL